MAQPQMQGPPYASKTAGIGGLPTPSLDIPVTAVFLALYACFAASNMTLLQINMRRQHKFLISGVLFGFCMARIMTCVLRIVWATRQHNVRVAITANILVNAGILIVYVVNIIFAQRILRAKQPHLGWNKVLRGFFKTLYVLIGAALICVIISAVLSAYTLNRHTLRICRDIQLTAITYLFVFTTLPWFLLAPAFLLPEHPHEEHFGEGSVNRKALVNLACSTLCVVISGFKCGSAWMPARPPTHPYWFQSKACFYVFNFGMEIIILSLLLSTRVDKLFHIPDGSKGPGDYTSRMVSSTRSSENGDLEVEKA